MVGLVATFLAIGAAYACLRTYAEPEHRPVLALAALAAPVLLAVAPFYLAWIDRRLAEPRDGLWHTGRLVLLRDGVDGDHVREHLRQWAIKAFFLAFMASIVPGQVGAVLGADPFAGGVVGLVRATVALLFLYDVCFGAIGYLATFRPLDAHIRSANPLWSGWAVALACYPPFALMGAGGPLDYRAGAPDWTHWVEGAPVLAPVWGGAIVALTFVYAWATVVFGLRFSNLTHRGVITSGPYRWVKHPAYLSKNLLWWLIHAPFLAGAGWADGARASALLLAVNALYWARARTEARHLSADPAYRAYAAWIAEHGLFARAGAALGRLGPSDRARQAGDLL
jgi:protein-S-isoprenylcysteine O-methyltransferase Ste14